VKPALDYQQSAVRSTTLKTPLLYRQMNGGVNKKKRYGGADAKQGLLRRAAKVLIQIHTQLKSNQKRTQLSHSSSEPRWGMIHRGVVPARQMIRESEGRVWHALQSYNRRGIICDSVVLEKSFAGLVLDYT